MNQSEEDLADDCPLPTSFQRFRNTWHTDTDRPEIDARNGAKLDTSPSIQVCHQNWLEFNEQLVTRNKSDAYHATLNSNQQNILHDAKGIL
jgi:hypothetical protein